MKTHWNYKLLRAHQRAKYANERLKTEVKKKSGTTDFH